MRFRFLLIWTIIELRCAYELSMDMIDRRLKIADLRHGFGSGIEYASDFCYLLKYIVIFVKKGY